MSLPRTIIGIGRNYAAHAAELKNTVPAQPFWFYKPPSVHRTCAPATVLPLSVSPYPVSGSQVCLSTGNPQKIDLDLGEGKDVHYETEMVVRIGRRGCSEGDVQQYAQAVAATRTCEPTTLPTSTLSSSPSLSADQAHLAGASLLRQVVDGVGVGLDFTDRVAQAGAKQAGLPWSRAKGIRDGCPVSQLVTPPPSFFDACGSNAYLLATKNDVCVQSDSTKHMIHSLPSLLLALTSVHPLLPGDLILTGTPAGVGPVAHGDVIRAVLLVDDEVTANLAVQM